MTNAEAQAYFFDFNQRYFDGKLPPYRIEIVKHLGLFTEGQIEKKQRP